MSKKYKIARRLVTVLSVFAMLVIVGGSKINAHPGNTASDGGHYCWTNCDYWGEVYGQRHFHGGEYVEEEEYSPDPPDEYDRYNNYDYSSDPDDYSGSVSSASTTYNHPTTENKYVPKEKKPEISGWLILIGAAITGCLVYAGFAVNEGYKRNKSGT